MRQIATNLGVMFFLYLYLVLAVPVLSSCSAEQRLQRKADKTGECQYKPARKAPPKGFL